MSVKVRERESICERGVGRKEGGKREEQGKGEIKKEEYSFVKDYLLIVSSDCWKCAVSIPS